MATEEKKKIRVTLVDDSDIFVFLFKNILANHPLYNIEINTFHDGLEALSFFSESSDNYPDFLFVDINMPFMSGWELLDALTIQDIQFVKHIPVYIISSSISSQDYKKVSEYPFLNGYLSKPFQKNELIQLINKYLAQEDGHN